MKVIVVGGSSGLGKAIAEQLAEEGHEVLTMQRRAAGETVPLDLRWEAPEIERAMERAVERLGDVDACVLAGGVGAFTEAFATAEQIAEIVQTNDVGPRLVFQGLLRRWKRLHRVDRQARLRVLYLGSSSVRNRAVEIEHYAASKAAAEKYFLEVGRRYAKWGVRANVIGCGWAKTPMSEPIEPAYRERIERSIPLKRMARPEEVAEMVSLCLRMPEYCTAGRFDITGGL